MKINRRYTRQYQPIDIPYNKKLRDRNITYILSLLSIALCIYIIIIFTICMILILIIKTIISNILYLHEDL